MEWLLIVMAYYHEPHPVYHRFVTQIECETVGKLTKDLAIDSKNKMYYKCLEVKKLER